MPFGRTDGVFGTLRFRLAFWNTAVLLLVLAATLAGLHVALEVTLYRELDHLLAEDAEEARLVLERYHPDWPQAATTFAQKARSHTEDDWFVQVYTADGALLIQSDGAPGDAAAPRPDAPGDAFTAGGRRVVERRHEGQPPLLVRVGAGLTNIESDLGRMRGLMLAAALVSALAAPAAGYWLAGRATRPLAAILATAGRLRPDRMSERLPLGGSGDELDRLAATVNGLLDRLAGHLEQQRTFIANAAHELRSPLAALRTSAEVALEQERTPEEHRELLADVVEECGVLGTLVNQLLLLAAGDAGRLQPGTTPVRLDELVLRSVDMFQGVAESREVALTTGPLTPAAVLGNGTHVRQVVHNLLDNAIKFTPAGGEVRAEVHVLRDGAAGRPCALLRITDTGCGIAAEDLPHVFERFYRADKSRRRDRDAGSGLGLSICQAVVTAYGGRISLTSTPGRGTTAEIFLPLCDNNCS